jgi:hypothetical protein
VIVLLHAPAKRGFRVSLGPLDRLSPPRSPPKQRRARRLPKLLLLVFRDGHQPSSRPGISSAGWRSGTATRRPGQMASGLVSFLLAVLVPTLTVALFPGTAG